MLKVVIPSQKEFLKYKNECKVLYEKNQDKIGDKNSFDFVCKNTFFYVFITGEILIGCIYYFYDNDGNLCLNAFSKPKMYPLNIECLKLSTTWFNIDIYAQVQNRASALCLIKAGFKRINKTEFILEK